MKNMFNIYYVNKEKASEISMLIDNEIVEKISKTKGTDFEASGKGDVSTEGFAKIPLLNKIIPNAELGGDLTYSKSSQVVDTVNVVNSTSTILRPIYEKAKEIRRLDDGKVGNLIKIKDVFLSVVNMDDVMATKALMSGLLNQVSIDGLGNVDLTSLMKIFFKDSAYILSGSLPHRLGKDENLMLKIPMSIDNEMESQYSISDLEIGKITIIGIYKGKFEKLQVESKINNMMKLDNKSSHINQQTDLYDDIEDGNGFNEDKLNLENKNIHYIDVIAIIQEVNI